MTAQAKNLSGGQKRKLSVGIAILGDPKVCGVWIFFFFHSFVLMSDIDLFPKIQSPNIVL